MREFSKILTFLKILDLFQNCGPFCVNCQNFGFTIQTFFKFFDLFKVVYLSVLIVKKFYVCIINFFYLFQFFYFFSKFWTFLHLDLLFMCEFSNCLTFFKIVDLFAFIDKILDLLFMCEFSKRLTFYKIVNCPNFRPTLYASIIKILELFQNCGPFCINRQNFGPNFYA